MRTKLNLLSNVFPGARVTKEDVLKRSVKSEAVIGFREATQDEYAAVLKASGTDELPEGYVAGWASTTDLDEYYHIIKTGAFDDAIRNRGLKGPKGIKFLANHNHRQVIGNIVKLETRKGNLWIEAQMNLNISYAKDLYEGAKSAGGLNFSVGFFMQKYTVIRDNDGEPTHIEIEKGDLFEVSIVPFPGNTEATMQFIKSLDDLSKAEGPGGNLPFEEPAESVSAFEKRLVEAGYAESRNEAKAITLEVKRLLKMAQEVNAPFELFSAPKAPEAKTAKGPSPEALAKLSAALERAQKMLEKKEN